MTTLHLTPLDPRYPSRLRRLSQPPATLSVAGDSTEAEHVVAIVGSRLAHPEAAAFARTLAGSLVRAGAVVVSGGALGIDAAAHRGALEAGGRTWAVAGTGCQECFPPEHASLYAEIAAGPGAMIWPFSPDSPARQGAFVLRNRVLVALSDAVVVVQAGLPSGALNAAAYAVRQRIPLWVVPAPPWLGPGFAGSRRLLDQGARSLQAVDALFAALGLGPRRSSSPPPPRPLSDSEAAVASVLGNAPGSALHLDEIASRAQSPAPAVLASLLTLALENVVVEGPPGFFRRQSSA